MALGAVVAGRGRGLDGEDTSVWGGSAEGYRDAKREEEEEDGDPE